MSRTSPSSITAAQMLVALLCSSSRLSAQGRDRTPPTAPTNLMVRRPPNQRVAGLGPIHGQLGQVQLRHRRTRDRL